jgi:hypothetical protein
MGDDVPQEVSVVANSIGHAVQQLCRLDLHADVAIAIAQRLYDQGLLKTPVSEKG